MQNGGLFGMWEEIGQLFLSWVSHGKLKGWCEMEKEQCAGKEVEEEEVEEE